MADELVKPSEWIKLLDYSLKAVFGDHVPALIPSVLGTLLLVAVLSAVVVGILIAIGKAKDIWIEKLRPIAYSPDEKKRSRDRRLFASHVLRELNQRNLAENWRDDEFADLEAEVEAEGRRRSLLPWSDFSNPTGIRREPSLTRALEKSTERLILVEGEPGSGKSVALRHVAQNIATRATRSKKTSTLLPIFVNLKELKRDNKSLIDRDLIRHFILDSLNRVNDRFVDEFLEAEFDPGIQNGNWIFLFDSFDEIPDVLSSTEADRFIIDYSEAISNFLGGLNSCRGVVASRFYRGPAQKGWQRFRIVELSSTRQQELIDRSLLKPDVASQLRGELALTNDDIQRMVRNPMLLGLLCEHVRLGNQFPTLAHEVFDKYFSSRFNRDSDRVKQRFNLDVDALRASAEQIAFLIASSPALGLSPSRRQLFEPLRATSVHRGEKAINRLFDALEYLKIGRGDRDGVPLDERQFTFSHRRFQEYFATCIVVRDPGVITSDQLLLDARWRETAVVLCQTGKPQEIEMLLSAANELVEKAVKTIRNDDKQVPDSLTNFPEFKWPERIFHVLNILQTAFAGVRRDVPDQLRQAAATIVLEATSRGSLLDRKLALEVGAVASQETLIELIRSALQLDSQWLGDVVYRQVARLSSLPLDVAAWVRRAILRTALAPSASRRHDALRAHVARLPEASQLRQAVSLAYFIRKLDLFSVIITGFLGGTVLSGGSIWRASVTAVVAVIFMHWLPWRYFVFLELFYVFMLARLYAVFILLLVVARLHSENDIVTFAVVAGFVVYLSVWPIAAAFCVNRGYVNRLLWPVIPFQVLRAASVRSVVSGVISIVREICGSIRGAASVLILMFLTVMIIWFEDSAVFWYVKGGMYVVGAGLTGLLIVGGAIAGWRAVRDYRRYRRAGRDIPRWNCRDLIDMYETMSTGFGRYKLLNSARVSGLFSRSGNLFELKELAARIGARRLSRPQGRLGRTIGATDAFFPVSVFLRLASSGFESDQRDEVFMMIEEAVQGDVGAAVGVLAAPEAD